MCKTNLLNPMSGQAVGRLLSISPPAASMSENYFINPLLYDTKMSGYAAYFCPAVIQRPVCSHTDIAQLTISKTRFAIQIKNNTA